MKSALRLFCMGFAWLISMAAPAQRKWRNAWKKSWEQLASCRDSSSLLACMQQLGYIDSLHAHTLVQWMGKTAGMGTSLQVDGKWQQAGTDFFPLPYSGEGDFDADVLAGIQELNKPWLVNLQSLYVADSPVDSLQAIYTSARQAQQNGATAWIAYGVLPENWMKTCDSTLFPELFIPVIYLRKIVPQEGESLHVTGHIRMKDSLLTAALMASYRENRASPAFWLICSKGDVQASWFALLSRSFLQQSAAKPVNLRIIWIPDHFQPALAQAFVQFILQRQAIPVQGILAISTDASLSSPRLQIYRQADYWKSLLQPDVSKSWYIDSSSGEAPFSLFPSAIPVAHLWMPRASSTPDKQQLFMHQQAFALIRQAIQRQTGLSTTE